MEEEEIDKKETLHEPFDTKETLKEPLDEKEDLDSNKYIFNSIKSKQKSYIKWIILILFFIIIILLAVGIFIMKIIISDLEENKIEIICKYKVEDNNLPINLLSKDFIKQSNIFIYIDGRKISYNINHTYKENKTYEVTFYLYNFLKLENMFKDAKNLYSVEIQSGIKSSFDVSLANAFANCQNLRYFISNIKRGNIIDMSYMFSNCNTLENVIFESIGNSTKNFSHMFENCIHLKSVKINNFGTNKAEDMSYMFFNCRKLQLQSLIDNFDTSKVTNMSYMFSHCSSLKSLNLSNLNTSLVTDMSNMCSYCTSLISIDLTNLNTNSVTNMSNMFFNCSSLTEINLINFDINLSTDISNMFGCCNNNLNILGHEKFNTSLINDMQYRHNNCNHK